MEWLKEIEVLDLLDGDVALIADALGLDILIQLWREFPSINLYISTKPLVAAKKRYIRRFYDGNNIKKLARLLHCSEKFIYKAISKKRVKGEFKEEGKGL
jgi:Mor family transcriptional regulator